MCPVRGDVLRGSYIFSRRSVLRMREEMIMRTVETSFQRMRAAVGTLGWAGGVSGRGMRSRLPTAHRTFAVWEKKVKVLSAHLSLRSHALLILPDQAKDPGHGARNLSREDAFS